MVSLLQLREQRDRKDGRKREMTTKVPADFKPRDVDWEQNQGSRFIYALVSSNGF